MVEIKQEGRPSNQKQGTNQYGQRGGGSVATEVSR